MVVWLFQSLMRAVSTNIVTRVGCVVANTFWAITTEKGRSTGHVVAYIRTVCAISLDSVGWSAIK
jgi:hypothetical protein